ncbi:hypothetical protein [Marinobacterium jannaschii]|uniref:hypothetical protein n=1 Tax=Marinobacterium jannaschii TaxID=64970 RepID=UPI000488FF77|nr:hypothetical protein [Marinobacterium jannaschii]
MQDNLQSLIEQAEELRDGLKVVHDRTQQVQYNSEAIREQAKLLKKYINMIGNNRIAAMAAKDKRKVMGEMEDAIDRLLEFVD